MKIIYKTLGCKVNQNETAAIQYSLENAGFETTISTKEADIAVVNSCTVTAQGAAKSLKVLADFKAENPKIITVLTGCLPQSYTKPLQSLPADIVTGTKNRSQLLFSINGFLQHKKQLFAVEKYTENELFEPLINTGMSGHTRAFIKIQDGCNRSCSYCIIPKSRGPARSAPLSHVVSCAKSLAEKGYTELVLTGINLSCYASEWGENIAVAVAEIAKIQGIERIRLGSLEPDLLDLAVVKSLSNVKKLCPSFHISLQSGCDETLLRMGRRYTAAQYKEVVENIKKHFSCPTFTTDVIVGFPGETKEEFHQTAAFVRSVGFLKVHIFCYSKREGTVAFDMGSQLSKAEKQLRSRQLSQICLPSENAVKQALKNIPDTVLLEKIQSDGSYSGYTTRYVKVNMRPTAQEHFATGKIVRFMGND